MSDVPSPVRIQKALWAWRESLEDMADDDVVQNRSLLPNNKDIHEVLHDIIKGVRLAEDRAAQCDTDSKHLADRAKRYDARAQKMRQIAIDIMQIIGVKSKEYHDATVTISTGREGFIVKSMDLLPGKYKSTETNTETKINRKELLSDLSDGLVIEGVEKTNGAPILTIRTR